ncbi:MAG: DNA metabolism protein [Clostridiales bacterium]|nr:DNA metabolism protein [Clostridiales bacterium]
MPEGRDMMLVYDGTFEGFLTAVFDSYGSGYAQCLIASQEQCQPRWGMDIREVSTDTEKYERVMAGVRRRMGQEGYEQVWTGFLSDDPRREDILLAYIRLGMKAGQRIHQMLTDDRVIAQTKMSGLVRREAHLLIQFARFACMSGGVYYAAITPEHHCLALLMPHFVDRFRVQPFVLHDKTHQLAGVFDRKEWVIASAEDLTLPDCSDDEQAWQKMWKAFYDTVAIRERYNPRCRMNHMPKKYWKNMVEMTSLPTPDDRPLPSRPLAGDCPLAGDSPLTDGVTAGERGGTMAAPHPLASLAESVTPQDAPVVR